MMQQRHARSRAATTVPAAVVWLLMSTAAAVVLAGERPAGDDDGRLSFRRIYAPADHMQDWPTGQERYLPIDADELDRLLEHARRYAMDAPVEGVPFVRSARFEAMLDGTTLRQGRAELEVVYDAGSEALLWMDDVSLAMGRATWNNDPATPAIAGRWSDGRYGVLVRNTGTLVIPWSQQGARDIDQGLRFRLGLPRAVERHLQLTLPGGLVPHTDHGVVISGPTDNHGPAVWHLRLGPERVITLRVVDQPLDHPLRSAPLQSSVAYDIAPEGIRVTASFSMSTPEQQEAELQLSLAPPLQATGVLLDGQPVPWRAVADPATPDLQLLAVLESQDDAPRQKLVVHALAPIRLNRLVRLPQVRMRGLEWESGRTRIFVNDPLEITRLELDGCVQIDSQPRAAPRSGDSLELADYRPDAAVEIQLAHHRGRVRWEHASTVVVGPDEATSTTRLRWSGATGRHRLVTPRINPDWAITEVQSDPRGLVRFWDVDRTDPASPRVVIQWNAPGTPPGGGLIRLTGRRVWTPTRGRLQLGDVSMLDHGQWRKRPPLLGLRASEPYRLHVEGSSPLNVVTYDSLPTDEAALLDAPRRTWLVRCDHEAMSSRFSLIRRTPAFEADVRLDFLVDRTANVLREQFTIACSPQASRVDRFRVHFHGADVAGLQWDIPDGRARAIELPDSRPRNNPSNGTDATAWEIVLDQPKRTPFTINAHRRRASPRGWRMPLVSVPDAHAAEARVVVRSESPSDVSIRAVQLERIDHPTATGDEFPDVRATFAYDATGQGLALSQGSLVLDAHDDRRLPASACVRNAILSSNVAAHGDIVHTVAYAVYNLGRETLAISLPTNMRLQAAWRDGTPVALQQAGASDSDFSLKLPPRRQCDVVLQFQELGTSLGTVHWLVSAFPVIDIPVLSRRWTIRLPPAYVPLQSPPNLAAPRDNLLRRLLGPLAGRNALRPSSTMPPQINPSAWRYDAVGAIGAEGPAQQPTAGNVVTWSGIPPAGPSGGQRGIAVVNQQRVFLLGLGVFVLFTTLFAVYLSSVRFRIVLFFATAILALLLPAAVVPLVCAALVGALAGQGLRLLLPVGTRPARPEADNGRPASEMPPIAVAGSSLLVAWLLAVAAVEAAEPTRQTAPSTTPGVDANQNNQPPKADQDKRVHSIWIPMDEENQPTRDARYISEALFEELYRRSYEAQQPPRAWTLAEAYYDVTIVAEEASGEFRVPEFTAHFEVVVVGRPADVEIPLSTAEGGWEFGRPRIDSQTSPAEYQASQGRVVVAALSAGRHHVTVPVRRAPGAEPAAPWIDFQIPRVPTSRVRVTAPAGLDDICVPDAFGHVRRQRDGKLVADLGSTSRLRLTWLSEAMARQDSAVPPVRELYWLKVRPAGVTVDARLRLTPWQRRQKEIVLLADPRLQLAPLPDDSPIAETQVLADRPQKVVLRLDEELGERDEIELRFLLAGGAAIGHLRFPFVGVQSDCAGRALVAVSFSRGLEVQENVPEGLEPVEGASFLEAWGSEPDGDVPQVAYVVPPGPLRWMAATRPRSGRFACQQTLTVDVGRDRARLTLSAEIEPIEGESYQYRMAVPLDLEIEWVAIREFGTDRPVRWSSGPPGYVNVFLAEPLVQTGRIQLEGTMPVNRSGEMPMPMLRVEQARSASSTVHLLRRPDVRVHVIDAVGLRATELPSETGLRPGSSRPVATYEVVDQPVSARLRVSDKEARADATLLTTVRWRNSKWYAVVDFLADVTQGPVDDIAFDIPDAWTEPYQVAPDGRTRIVPLPDGAGRQLWVRPAEPVEDGRFELRIAAPLDSTPGIIPRPPNLHPRMEGSLQKLIALPKQWNTQMLRWDTQGLVEVAWSTAADLGVPAPRGFRVYEVVAERFSAIPRTVASRDGTPMLHHADTEVAIIARDAFYGVTAFRFDPAGASQCGIHAAPGTQIEQVVVNGSAASFVAGNGDGYDVLLGPPAGEQRVEVVFSSAPPDTVARRRPVASIRSPRLLVGNRILSSEDATWTIHAPPEAAVTGLEPARPLSPRLTTRDSSLSGEDALPVSKILVPRGRPATQATTWITRGGDAPALRVRVDARFWSPTVLRLMAAMILAAACLTSLVLRQRPWGRDLFWRWPHVALVLAGWIAALTVQPAFLGWATMAAGALLALLAAPRAPAEASRASPSTTPVPS